MRVLHVINGLGTGGAERSLAELLPVLRDRGIDATVVCLRTRDAGVEAVVRAAGVDVRVLSAQRLPGRIRALRSIVREVRPDLIHTTIFDADILGRLAAVGTKVPVMSSVVNPSYGPARRADPNVARWRLEAVRVLDGWTARHLTDGILAISRDVSEAVQRDLGVPPGRIAVVPRGRDARRMVRPSAADRAAARDALGLAPDQLVLVHVGRQEFQKGLDVLLRSMPAVVGRAPTAILLQAGRRGRASADIDDVVSSLGLEDSVRFLGHRDDVPLVLAAADLFVFPSRFEGLGGSLIEAQAAGLAIVASDLAAIREVVEAGATADLVPPDDPASLASAILELLADPDRRRAYGDRGRRVFEERFTLDAIADRVATELRAVAAGGRSGGRR